MRTVLHTERSRLSPLQRNLPVESAPLGRTDVRESAVSDTPAVPQGAVGGSDSPKSHAKFGDDAMACLLIAVFLAMAVFA